MFDQKAKPARRIFICLIIVFCVLFASMKTHAANEPTIKIVLFPFRKAVIAARIDSVITQYNYQIGQHFDKGASIVKLDSRQHHQTFLKAKAADLEADTQFQFRQKVHKNNMQLYNDGALGIQELERGKMEMEVARSKHKLAQATVKMAELKVNFCTIRAPFAGKLIRKDIFEHEFVKIGQPIMEIIDNHKLLAFMHLPSSRINTVKIGAKMKFRIDETGAEHEGEVYEIAGVIDPGSRTFEVRAVLDNQNQILAPGMSGVLIE